MDEISFTILGEPASKANSRRLVTIGGKPRVIKSKKALSYSKEFEAQCPNLEENVILDDVSVNITIYYSSRRPDLDESLILDLMQERVYKNDRQVKEKHIFWKLDKDNPRSIIKISRLHKQ